MKDDDVRDACVLAYELLRRPDCAIAPPPAMANFVHQPRLSPRALTVAQDSIERDPAFRSFVASRATLAEVGQAGMDWLGAIDLNEIDDLHRRIAELEVRLSETSHRLAEVSAELLTRTSQLAERTEQWRQALKDLSARQSL